MYERDSVDAGSTSTPKTAEQVQRNIVCSLVHFLGFIGLLTTALALHGNLFGIQQLLVGAWNWFSSAAVLEQPQQATMRIHQLLVAALIASTASLAVLALAAVPRMSRARYLVLPTGWLTAALMVGAAVLSTMQLNSWWGHKLPIMVLTLIASGVYLAWMLYHFKRPFQGAVRTPGVFELLAILVLALHFFGSGDPASCGAGQCSMVAISQGYWVWALVWALVALFVRSQIVNSLAHLPADHPIRPWIARFTDARDIKPTQRKY